MLHAPNEMGLDERVALIKRADEAACVQYSWRLEIQARFGMSGPVSSLHIVRVFAGAVRKVDFPNLVASEVEYLKSDASCKLKKQIASRVIENGISYQLVLEHFAQTLDRVDWSGQAVLLLMIKAAYARSAVYY